MSLRSNSSLSGHSIRSPLSPPYSTTFFYPKPTPIPPNKTLHIGNLRTGSFNGKTVQEELEELLSRQLGFHRIKICENRNLVGCFGVAYFASIQCATDAMNNLQGHPFAGSSKGLRIDYMAVSKREPDSQSLADDRMHQPQGFQNQRRYLDPSTLVVNQPQCLSTKRSRGYLNDLPGPHWGYGSGVSPIETSPGSSPPAGVVGGKVGFSEGQLGDQPFNFRFGTMASNMGLQGSIYADIRVPTTPDISSKGKEGVHAEELKNISSKGKEIKSKDLTVIKGFRNEQKKVPGEKTEAVLLEFEVLPETQNGQKNDFENGPCQEELMKVMLLGEGQGTADELQTANPEVVVETTAVSTSDCVGSVEAEM